MVTLGQPRCMVDQDQPCCDGTRMTLLGWHCSWHYWERPHWNGTSMVSWDWLHWDSTERVLLKQWHWDGLAGMVALGLPWDEFIGLVAPGQPCNSLGTRAVGLVLHRWPCQDGTRVASLGQHRGGLPSTCALSLPHSWLQGPQPPLLLLFELRGGEDWGCHLWDWSSP